MTMIAVSCALVFEVISLIIQFSQCNQMTVGHVFNFPVGYWVENLVWFNKHIVPSSFLLLLFETLFVYSKNLVKILLDCQRVPAHSVFNTRIKQSS